MFEEYENKKRKQVASMKSLMDYGMGILILLLGVFFFFRGKLGNIELNEKFPPDNIDKLFGGFCLLYGAWRIYRGYKKNYFK
jgi:threonine/homoserine/homoserine lactone efflux protein